MKRKGNSKTQGKTKKVKRQEKEENWNPNWKTKCCQEIVAGDGRL